jgi:effector-binding domain-containing protein
MPDTPHITHTAAQHTAMIALTVPRSEIARVMGPGIREVFAALAAQGLKPAGPWFTHHLRIAPDIFDLEICVPIPSPVSAVGRVKPSTLRAAKVAHTVYTGSYEGLGVAWGEFKSWVAANGYEAAGDLWECYLVGPESSSDAAQWRTQLNQPLVD